jgi:regulatory protein
VSADAAGENSSLLSCPLASLGPYLYARNVPFRSNSQKIAGENELYSAALLALVRRAYSIHEMKEYLGRRAQQEDAVSPVIARLREQTYLDDAKYARDYARLHAQSRRQGKFRITRELRARGVPDHHIDAALESVFAETDETELARERIKRKLSQLRGSSGKPIDQKKIASLYRSLMAAGFSADVIRSEIRHATKTDPPEISDARGDEM